jgi:hypothetical protein
MLLSMHHNSDAVFVYLRCVSVACSLMHLSKMNQQNAASKKHIAAVLLTRNSALT